MNFLKIVISFILGIPAFAITVEEAMPITSKNLIGHKALYIEGWFVVSSTRQSLDYAYQNSVVSSADAWKKMSDSLKNQKTEFQKSKTDNEVTAKVRGQKLSETLTKARNSSNSAMQKTAVELDQTSIAVRKKAFAGFVIGYAELRQRTQEDVTELKKASQKFGSLKKDFSNYLEIFEKLDEENRPTAAALWQKSFVTGSEEFQKEYAESTKQPNSLLGLWNIAAGYLKATYHGLLVPSGTTTVALIGTSFKLVEHTIVSIGSNFYYASRIGYKIVSPTVEAGLLSSLSLIAWTSSKMVSATGAGLSVINQVAIVSSKPVYQGGRWLVATTSATANYAALTAYEVGKAAGLVVVNQVKVGLVLGYNALTAIPAQAVMGAANSVIFLAYEGPKLAIYSGLGKIDGISIADLPVGSVIDLQKLKDQNIEVKKINEDSEVIQMILKSSGKDQ